MYVRVRERECHTLHDSNMSLARIVQQVGNQMLIRGKHINRAIDGDIVVVRPLPECEWRSPSALLVHDDMASGGALDMANMQDESAIPSATIDEQGRLPIMPTGAVVGIIRRSWRPYVAPRC
jgi:exosome complex exonuclease DIS3/RRP44